jgi:hypothetical protein
MRTPGPNYDVTIDVTAWGWIHLIVGIVVAFAGFAVFSGRTWGRLVGRRSGLVNASSIMLSPYDIVRL